MILENPDGSQTFYVELGQPSDEALILLHGLGADHGMWSPQLGPFAEAGFYVLAPDLLAHGASSKVTELSLSDWDQQILHLLKAKGVERCIPIGVSMGGVSALSFAVNQTERVSKLVVSDTFAELKTVNEKLLGFSQVIGFHLFKLLGRKLFARSMASAYKASFASQARRYLHRVSLEADFEQLLLARKAINRIAVLEDLRKVDIPALVMAGDQFGKQFIEINRKIAEVLPYARFILIEQAMDPSNLVNPAAFNREVLRFLPND